MKASPSIVSLWRRLAVAVLLAAVAGGPVLAQRSAPHPPAAVAAEAQKPQAQHAPEGQRLPSDVTTEHALELPGRTLHFAATVAAIPLLDGEGALQAEVATIAYVRRDIGGRERPVTFVFNGGPGAASAYLHIGALGPWRLPLARIAPSLQAELVANAETWLDFTDLVFIDPPGTGYSRVVAGKDGARKRFWSVDGDADALAVVIRKWVEKTGRQNAPKFIAGESYGGFRAPKIAKELKGQGIGIRGLVMISPVIDFASFGQRRHAPMSWVYSLPSMAAAALEVEGKFDPAALAEAERYASGDYLRDLLKGERDAAAVERLSARVAALTGLDPALVRKRAGRIDTSTFQRELHGVRGMVASAYDPAVTAFDPYPTSSNSRFSDPVLDGMTPLLTAAMTDFYRRVLAWKVDRPYRLLEREVSSSWDWGRGRSPPEAVDDLRNVLAGDAAVRVLVVHGASDLVTPYFANKMLLDQLPVYGDADRIKLAVYAGGHMFYDRDGSRRALRADAEALYRTAVQGD